MANKRKWVSAEEFVRAWQRAESQDALAQTLGTTVFYVRTRGCLLRKRGVPLKTFPRSCRGGRAPLDIKALVRIAKAEGRN